MESLEVRYLDRNLPRITISIGVAAFPDCGDDLQAVFRAANEALYKAKENGRNRVELSPMLNVAPDVPTESCYYFAARSERKLRGWQGRA